VQSEFAAAGSAYAATTAVVRNVVIFIRKFFLPSMACENYDRSWMASGKCVVASAWGGKGAERAVPTVSSAMMTLNGGHASLCPPYVCCDNAITDAVLLILCQSSSSEVHQFRRTSDQDLAPRCSDHL